MRKTIKHLLLIVMTILFTLPVSAATLDFGDKNILVYGESGPEDSYIFPRQEIDGISYDVKVTKVTSSNKKVLKVKRLSNGFDYKPIKPGTATVTVKATIAGTSYTIKKKFFYKKTISPFAYISVNGIKAFNKLKMNGSGLWIYGKSPYNYSNGSRTRVLNKKLGSSIKIKWKLNSGWKIVSADYGEHDGTGSFAITTRQVKNGSKIKMIKEGALVYFTLKDSHNAVTTIQLSIFKNSNNH